MEILDMDKIFLLLIGLMAGDQQSLGPSIVLRYRQDHVRRDQEASAPVDLFHVT